MGMEYAKAYLSGIEEYALECSCIKILGPECITYVSDEGV